MDNDLNKNTGDPQVPPVSPPQTPQTPEGWKEEYPSFERQMPKKFWGHPYFSDKKSLEESLDGLLNPKKKAPESYSEIEEDVGSIFKELDLTQEQAKKVAEAYAKKIPAKVDYDKILNERFGDKRKEAEESADKALKAFLSQEQYESFKQSDFSKSADFIEFARLVGKNVGDDSRNFTPSQPPKTSMYLKYAKGLTNGNKSS